MSILLNDPGCQVNSGNSGLPGCRFDPGLIVSAVLVDKDHEFTWTNAAQFISDMQALCIAGRSTRAFPIHNLVMSEDKTTEPSFKENGYGARKMTSEGKPDFIFEVTKGGHAYQGSLRRFNKDEGKRVIFVDANNIVLGARTGTATFKGFALEFFYASPTKYAKGKDDPSTYMIEFAMRNIKELNEDLAFFDLGADGESSFQGLLDIEMYAIGAGSATKKHIIGVRSVSDKVDLYDAYSAAVVTNFASIFTAKKAGVTANPIACVAVPASKGWELEFAATGEHVITMAGASVLDGLGIGAQPDIGFDIETAGTLTVTVV